MESSELKKRIIQLSSIAAKVAIIATVFKNIGEFLDTFDKNEIK